MQDKIKIIMADDSSHILDGVSDFISDEEDMSVESKCTDGEEAIKEIENSSFDLLLLDLSMPKKNGFEVLQTLTEKKINIPVLVFTNYAQKDFINLAKKLGTRGFLSKDGSPEELVSAIRIVYNGGTLFNNF